MTPTAQLPMTSSPLIALIMCGLLAWGVFHAIGASRGMVVRLPSQAEPARGPGSPGEAPLSESPAAIDGRQEQRLPANPLKGLVVLGCSGGFLAFWGILLWSRSRRLDHSVTVDRHS